MSASSAPLELDLHDESRVTPRSALRTTLRLRDRDKLAELLLVQAQIADLERRERELTAELEAGLAGQGEEDSWG